MKPEQFTFRIWPPDHTARLEAMWWQGISALDIAVLLGGYTAQQVREKASRQGFTRDPALKAAKQPAPEPAAVMRGDGAPVCMANVRGDECHWIYGEPGALAPMCGNKATKHRPWCGFHLERAYQ